MSLSYLCLHCWRVPKLENCLFRCPECAEPGDPLDWMRLPKTHLRRVSELRKPFLGLPRWDDDEEEGRRAPVRCPDHPQARVQLFCECEYPLADQLAVSGGLVRTLGFAGPRSVGKTVLTVAMIESLHGSQHDGKRLEIRGLADSEKRFLVQFVSPLAAGEQPSPSPRAERRGELWSEDRNGQLSNFAWNVFASAPEAPAARKGPPPLVLALYDLGGESWGDHQHEALEHFDRYVSLLGSLVFVIDGAAVAADLGLWQADSWQLEPPKHDGGAEDREWFGRVKDRLAGRSQDVDLALLISKADHLWEQPSLARLHPSPEGTFEEGQGLLEDVLRQSHRGALLEEGRRDFRRVGLFAASSLGFRPGPGDVDQNGRLTRPRRPAGVTEPVWWLLGERLSRG